jgi:hypothetical protein
MKKVITFFVLMFVLSSFLLSQTPQYYNFNSGGTSNTIPFGSTGVSGYKSQWLLMPNAYNNPTPVPSGNKITKLYIRGAASGGPIVCTQLKIRLGQTADTTLPTGAAYTGPMDSVYFKLLDTVSTNSSGYTIFTLQTPYVYNPSLSLVIEISHCGFTGTGFSVYQYTALPNKRTNSPGTTSCVFTWSGTDSRTIHSGVDVVPVGSTSVNRSILLPTPGVNTNYVQVPYNAAMVGFQTITIEAWVKIGGTTTANTILNKGGSSFDYQLGILTSTAKPFFRGPSSQASSNLVIPVGVWTHLAVTSNGTTATFYMNGVPEAPISSAVALGSSSNEMRIGKGNADAGSGKIDELRLWNVVRTAAEISANMCNKWVPNNATGLLAKWHFDSTLVDSVHGWNGTFVNNVTYDTAMNCIVTHISGNQNELPKEFKLNQNYPNPFNPTTTITFSIPKDAFVEMKLYDVIGREVATLVSDPYRAGVYRFDFNASNLSSGIYFYQITAGDFKDIKKMMLLK